MGEGERRRRRMKGGERRGRRGQYGGLTACEYSLTSRLRLRVFSAGLEESKIKPRNVNLFSIVDSKRRRRKRRIHTYQVRAGQNSCAERKCALENPTGEIETRLCWASTMNLLPLF